MADIKPNDDDDVKLTAPDPATESFLRGAALEGADQRNAPDHVAYDKTRKTDQTLRLDGEEDTLYEDGLDIEDDSRPLTGIDGRDDSTPER
ncbi:MAG TPA: hypothetical protein VGD63_17725 [Steroidobacteraceae bacterium]